MDGASGQATRDGDPLARGRELLAAQRFDEARAELEHLVQEGTTPTPSSTWRPPAACWTTSRRPSRRWSGPTASTRPATTRARPPGTR